jgi:DNA-binding PadR family transcriptional regulator
MFDHEIVSRLVELGLVETEPFSSGDIEYRITDAGRAAATA